MSNLAVDIAKCLREFSKQYSGATATLLNDGAHVIEQSLIREAALREEVETLTKDGQRIDHLEELVRQCPHAEFDYCDDDDESKPLGFSITLEGCSGKEVSVGLTFRECVDEDIKLTATRNSE